MKLTQYTIKWEIDLDAESKLDAAKKALQLIIDSESTAHAFDVATFDAVADAVKYHADVELCYTLIDLDDIKST